VSWETYEGLLRALGNDHPALRMTYREGTLEITTTSPRHERIKKLLARLLEAWADENEVRLDGYGAATFRSEAAARGLEPDECYALGELGSAPDLAIEVVETHGDVDKLDVYAGLGVREVWIWEEGKLTVRRLESGRYTLSSASGLLPRIDLTLLAGFVREGDQTAIVREYRRALRASPR
jgi:Uma2 family endonuclease